MIKKTLADTTVKLHNTLTQANQGFSHINEKRVVMAALAKINEGAYDKRTHRYIVKLSTSDVIQAYPAFGTDNNAYSLIKNTLKKIMKVTFTTKEHHNNDGSASIHEDYWISGTAYNEKRGTFELRFTPEATPLLLDLQKNFTAYELKQAAGLSSLKSWRLLELLMQFKDTGWAEISIEQLTHAMDIPPSYLKNWAQLQRKVIKPAITELAKKNGCIIEYQPKKEGAKLKNIRFDFHFHAQTARNAKQRDKPAPQPQPAQPNINTKAEIAAMKHALNKEKT